MEGTDVGQSMHIPSKLDGRSGPVAIQQRAQKRPPPPCCRGAESDFVRATGTFSLTTSKFHSYMDSWEDLDVESVPVPAGVTPQTAEQVASKPAWGPAPQAPADASPALQFLIAQTDKQQATKILTRPGGAGARQSATPPPVNKSEQQMMADLQEKERSYAEAREKIFRGK